MAAGLGTRHRHGQRLSHRRRPQRSLPAKEGAAGIGLQLRVALCHSSLASLGANMQKDVLLALAKANRISPPRVIDLALSRKNVVERGHRYLVALPSALPADLHDHTYKLALSVAWGTQDVKQQADALLYIADHVPEFPSLSLLEQVRTLAYSSGSVDASSDCWTVSRRMSEMGYLRWRRWHGSAKVRIIWACHSTGAHSNT